MAVHAKALTRLHSVLVHHPQGTEAHVGRVVVGVDNEKVCHVSSQSYWAWPRSAAFRTRITILYSGNSMLSMFFQPLEQFL